MQTSSEESELRSSPSLGSGISEEFSLKMKLVNDSDFVQPEKSAASNEEAEVDDDDEEEDDDDNDDDDDEEFSFASAGADDSPIAADDAFQNGQIKPVFPLFDRSLLFGESAPSKEDFPRRPPVKKVFVEAVDSSFTTSRPPTAAAAEGNVEMEGEAAGPYCTWSRKAVEASPEICKKSNSTGFSKIWRFRETTRSNSDGRDAFVFLNNGSTTTTATTTSSSKVEKSEGSSAKKPAGSEAKANGAGGNEKGKGKKKAKKGETASAHELHYVRNRALREEDRKRSYLPYKPELVGFFTNVNGGLSRNVHPF